MDISNLTQEQKDALLLQMLGGGSPEAPHQPGVPPVNYTREFGEAPPPNPPTVQRLPTASQWVTKQIGNLTAVGQTNYSAGITRPKKDPIAAGIAAQAKYEAEMRKSDVLKRREEKLKKTNMDEWASMAERIGAPRLIEGVTARQYKVERFVGAFQPKLEAHLRIVDALPDVTDADRERRMLENLRGLKKLKGT